MFTAWKLIPTVLMIGALVAGLTVRPPREPISPVELGRLVVAVVTLYLVGTLAVCADRTALAALVFGAGLAVCALALWLSRGSTPPPRDDSDDGGGGEPPHEPAPPWRPDVSGPEFDWSFYEDQFRAPVP